MIVIRVFIIVDLHFRNAWQISSDLTIVDEILDSCIGLDTRSERQMAPTKRRE